MTAETLAQAQALLEALVNAAKTGAIIPIRLPAQLEQISELLAQAQQEAVEAALAAASAPPPVSVDNEAFLREQAQFISHAIHELRTPMTSIRGYVDMMRSMGGLNEMQQQFVETIRANSRRMESLLTDVSDTSKLKGGTLRTNFKMDMFKNIALMVEKQAQPLRDELGRKLTFDIPQGLPILNVDGDLLAKALYKLVENALRYSGREAQYAAYADSEAAASPTAEVGEVTVRAAAADNKLVVTIQDNGIGMTPADLAQLGTVYFRSESEVVRSFKGSGLGIPVAYGIIHLLGGTISVQSEPNVGTTFTITLVGIS